MLRLQRRIRHSETVLLALVLIEIYQIFLLKYVFLKICSRSLTFIALSSTVVSFPRNRTQWALLHVLLIYSKVPQWEEIVRLSYSQMYVLSMSQPLILLMSICLTCFKKNVSTTILKIFTLQNIF